MTAREESGSEADDWRDETATRLDGDAAAPEPDDDEAVSSRAVRQLSVVAVVLGTAALVMCFIPKVPLTYALVVSIAGAAIGLINCLSSTVLHEPSVRIIAATGTLICAIAIFIVLLL